MDEIITLDYGSGGKKTSKLIENIIVPQMNNPELSELGDGAILDENLVFSTDSFVVDPIFFPGGDIGKLAVCGTVNDIAMCGGIPQYLSCALIIEEGLKTEDLEAVINSMSEAAKKAKVKIVTGDTKVVEKGRGDKIYINTAGIGKLKYKGLTSKSINDGDAVIVSGTVGDHGTAIMLSRNKMMDGNIQSDCAPLNELCALILETKAQVKVLRDPTRGGVATTLNEFVEGTSLGIELEENSIPIRDDVKVACDILGLDPLYCANEGKLLCVVNQKDAQLVLEEMRKNEYGRNAQIIGKVSSAYPGKVTVKTRLGGSRIIQKLAGAQLPRIC